MFHSWHDFPRLSLSLIHRLKYPDSTFFFMQNKKDTKRSSNLLGERPRSQDYLWEATNEKIEGLFSAESLRWIQRISLWLKCSSRCGSMAAGNGGSWWPPVVVGGGGGGVRAWVGVWREIEWKIMFSMLKNVLIICSTLNAILSRVELCLVRFSR